MLIARLTLQCMVIVDHWAARSVLYPLICFLLAFWLRHALWARRVRFLTGLVMVCSVLLLLLNGCVVATTRKENSSLLFSPDRKKAIVVSNWTQGAVGGHGSDIDLYQWRGLRERLLAQGDMWTFSASSVRWLSDIELELQYEGKKQPYCESAAGVHVRCIPASMTESDVR